MKRVVLFLLVGVALLAPSAALASGVVLKVQRGSQLVAVTRSNTKVALVHTAASSKLHVGQRVSMTARKLRNGTFASSNVRIVGRARTVHFRGLLLKKTRTQLFLSAGGAVIAVNRGARTTSSASDTGPAPGATVDVTATVGTDDELDEDSATTATNDTPGGKIEGILTLGTGTVTIKSEHMNLTLKTPAGLDLSTFKNGDEVLVTFTQQPDGSLVLSAISADGNAQEADENDGDNNNDQNDDGDDDGGTNTGTNAGTHD